uniref:Uncharacterized protein n=1 Tax=Spongospora subterranea TaxID=70186 RepID=A0A0H5RGF7_9EUKA|eukprot:CRZ07758.1 hypothetical protein [Spongospora subterranea]
MYVDYLRILIVMIIDILKIRPSNLSRLEFKTKFLCRMVVWSTESFFSDRLRLNALSGPNSEIVRDPFFQHFLRIPGYRISVPFSVSLFRFFNHCRVPPGRFTPINHVLAPMVLDAVTTSDQNPFEQVQFGKPAWRIPR